MGGQVGDPKLAPDELAAEGIGQGVATVLGARPVELLGLGGM